MVRLNSYYHEAVERSLDGFALRQQAIANNIANIHTPNYVNQAVSFEESLEEAMLADAAPKPAAHDATEITEGHHGVLLTWQPKIDRAADGAQRLDGNTVSVESQMSGMSQNAIKYNAVAMAIAHDFQLLKSISQAK